jgi:XTP/dITP diphosphohydrolase
MKNRILIATHNEHKIEEIRALFLQSGWGGTEVLSLKDIGFNEEIAETADTFEGNAWLKIQAIERVWQENILADDSGFEVESLGGKPGVWSARYAGVHGNHSANIAKVLSEMQTHLYRRGAFRTVLVGRWKGKPFQVEGRVEGRIARESIGWGGFGYDPIFIPDGNSRTFAEMSIDEKNLLSHRSIAFRNWISWVRKFGM